MTPHPPPKMTQGGNDPPNPPPSPSTASLSGVARCWHSSAYFSLFSSLFFFDPPNRFVQIPRDLSWFRSCWLCYFRYSTTPVHPPLQTLAGGKRRTVCPGAWSWRDQ